MTRLLLVEDDPQLRDLYGRFLSDYEVVKSASIEDALAHLSGGDDFDAAIVDFWLGETNAIPLLDSLRERLPDAACVLISGGNETHSPEITEAAGAISGYESFLMKPFQRSDLLDALESVLQSRELT